MDYKSALIKYFRPRFYELCKNTNGINIINSNILDLLIECVATIKYAMKEQFANVDTKELDEFKYLSNKFEFKYISKVETFAGCNYIIKHYDQQILLKCFSQKKAIITRNILLELIRILNTEINTSIFQDFCIIITNVIENELSAQFQYRFQEIAIDANNKISNSLIIIPKLIPTLFYRNIVPMEWLPGKSFFSYHEINLTEDCKNELLLLNYTLITEYKILRYDFHFSNYLNLQNNKIALLDYGSVFELGYNTRMGYEQSSELYKWVRNNMRY